ncbi:prolyl-tRNA synthetase [Thermosyntropha lipolytica DSM 11003]|uniref:Proline--tRNA ligase n=1 Tax=Thermosyntropha lipolytica DSM 11003 TaxID=1123382 RepID=A0A1M5KW34_9FIRM|nr:proline--tRNA ligase [Thermosyntropha lipolytica]SHG57024.1 prolyl-tRNA synthetase [Thermosyntropha lipolytica DSM 11003]
MKYSELFCPTLREVPSEAEVVSHQLLLRAGFIRKTTAGVYTYMPLAQRVLRKIMNIIREEMDRAGAQELLMPIIQPRELWEQSGRWAVYGEEMFRLKDRHNRDFALGPTHEELITSLVNADVHSYRDLPLMLYQIQNKYRDEIRPRFGLMRGREFIMKDLYSFDADYEGLDVSYNKMYEAYKRVFDRLNLKYRVVEADSGAIGGSESHEFVVLADTGESEIVFCDNCDYAANVEKASCLAPKEEDTSPLLDLEKIATPGQKTIEEVARFLGLPASRHVKTLLYKADGEIIAVVIRGDRELNETKLKNFLHCTHLAMAEENEVRKICAAGFGSLGPVGLPCKVYADLEVARMRNFVCGANEDGFHLINVNMGRDFVPEAVADLRNAVKGDKCPVCGKELEVQRGIEVGHIFKLGTKYSEAMGATFLDQDGKEKPFIMGCYGIGVSRTMAAAVEQNHDEDGIIWPVPIAPYQVIIVPVNIKDAELRVVAEEIYKTLLAAGIEVILDDRDERAGVKFKDADLIGIPVRITIGSKSLKENKVEIKKRWEKDAELVAVSEVLAKVKDFLNI